MNQHKLTKGFLEGLPEGTVVLSEMYKPWGMVSWLVDENVKYIWDDAKSLGADQTNVQIFKTLKEYKAELNRRFNIAFAGTDWANVKAV